MIMDFCRFFIHKKEESRRKKCHLQEKILTFLLLKYDFRRPFSDLHVLNGRHISVTIQSTFIADSVAFQSPISNYHFKK